MEMKRWAYITSTGPCVLVLLSAALWPAVEESTCKWRKQINKIPCKAIKHRQIENTLTSFTTHGMTIAYKLQAQYRNKWRQPVSGVGKAANKFMFLHSDWQQLACSGMFSLFQCAMETCFCIWLCLHRVLLCCMYVLFIKCVWNGILSLGCHPGRGMSPLGLFLRFLWTEGLRSEGAECSSWGKLWFATFGLYVFFLWLCLFYMCFFGCSALNSQGHHTQLQAHTLVKIMCLSESYLRITDIIGTHMPKCPLWINWSRHFPLHSRGIHSGRRFWLRFNKNCPQHDKSLHSGHCCPACRSPSKHSFFVSRLLCISARVYLCATQQLGRENAACLPACIPPPPPSLTCTVWRSTLSNNHWAKHSLRWRGTCLREEQT